MFWQELRERVLRGKYRIPFYMSTDCENILKKFLVLNPVKRSALEVCFMLSCLLLTCGVFGLILQQMCVCLQYLIIIEQCADWKIDSCPRHMLGTVGTCESAVCVRIEYRIESGIMIPI